MPRAETDARARTVAAAQAAYYLATAAAPLAGRRRFESVTGPKTEWWLVITVSALVGAIGASLASAARRARVEPETRILGISAAGGLAAVDVVYVARRRISPVYLLDGALEAALLAGWLRA